MAKLELKQSTRYILLRVFLVVVLLVFVARLFQIQILDHQKYVSEANSMRVKQRELIAKRGQIYMMSGENETVPLVINERTWTIFVDPSYVGDKNKVQVELGKILDGQMITTWDKVWSDMKNMYVEVARNVDYDTVSAVKAANLKGVGKKETSRRVYPYGTMAAQVVGFVNAEGVGTGIEGSLNKRLTGKNGMLKTVTDVNSVPLSIGDDNIEIPAEDGEDIVLTLDENIQRKAEKVIQATVDGSNGAARSASVLIMNPNNGHIWAMANYPTFSPAEYYKVTDASLFTNRTTESAYEPASVCKPFTYAIAINEKKLDPTDSYYNYGYTKVGDRIMKNATGTERQVGKRTFYEALDHSLNTGSIEALRRIGGENIPKAARTTMYNYLYNNFGLGHETGVELYEATGKIISPEEDEGNAVRYANMTFGQGMSLTMVQVAAGFSSVINGGKYYQPTILAGTMKDGKFIEAEPKAALREAITPLTSATMRGMLNEVRSVNGGYADKQGYNIGVKTGTAETYDESGKYTSNRTVVGAIGFGGSAKEGALPEYVILVRIDGNTLLWGVSNAVPVFTELSNYMLDYLRIEPVL